MSGKKIRVETNILVSALQAVDKLVSGSKSHEQCYKFKLVDPGEVFVEATNVKACVNNKKMQKYF